MSVSPSKRSAGIAGGASIVSSLTAREMRAAGPSTPLDYSFMGLATLSDMLLHDPVSGQKKAETTTGHDDDTSAGTSRKPTQAAAVSLRANNNKLTQLNDMDEALAAVFPDATKLQWLDLSGNALTSISPVAFAKYPDIFTLHLHGNKLAKYSDIDHIAAWLPRVHSLTLHGNPLEEKRHYKSYVIASFPQLRQLDFSCVTKGDRDKAETWAAIYRKALQNARASKGKHGAGKDAEYE